MQQNEGGTAEGDGAEGDPAADDSKIDIDASVRVPRRVVFVLDRSGSMSGSKWTKAVSATVTALRQLRAGVDRYAAILFNDEISVLQARDTDFLTDPFDKFASLSIAPTAAMVTSGANGQMFECTADSVAASVVHLERQRPSS